MITSQRLIAEALLPLDPPKWQAPLTTAARYLVIDEDAALLRREARLCRSLATQSEDELVSSQLISMADEYEARAADLELGS